MNTEYFANDKELDLITSNVIQKYNVVKLARLLNKKKNIEGRIGLRCEIFHRNFEQSLLKEIERVHTFRAPCPVVPDDDGKLYTPNAMYTNCIFPDMCIKISRTSLSTKNTCFSRPVVVNTY